MLKKGKEIAREYGCTKIVTFADHQVSNGLLYEKLGFTLDKELSPDYRYLVDEERKRQLPRGQAPWLAQSPKVRASLGD